MLYTRVPRYEKLKPSEEELYHYDKETYNKSARKGGHSFFEIGDGRRDMGPRWLRRRMETTRIG